MPSANTGTYDSEKVPAAPPVVDRQTQPDALAHYGGAKSVLRSDSKRGGDYAPIVPGSQAAYEGVAGFGEYETMELHRVGSRSSTSQGHQALTTNDGIDGAAGGDYTPATDAGIAMSLC